MLIAVGTVTPDAKDVVVSAWIHHNAGRLRELLQSADWKWLQNVEDTKEYKAGEKRFPGKRDGDEGDELAGDFVDDDELGIFEAGGAGDAGGGRECR